MLFREIFRILGVFFLFFSSALLVPLAISFYYDSSIMDFIFGILVSLLMGLGLYSLGGESTGTLYRREGIASVVLIWFLVPAISAVPFITSGTIVNPFQAYFEMVSGFTTSGSTVLHAKAYNQEGVEIPIEKTIPGIRPTTYTFYGTVAPIKDPITGELREGVEAVNRPLLFWRSFTQWLGGGGIIVLFVAILPALGIGGKVLYQSEVSTQTQEATLPRIKETALQLWKIYFALTVLQIIVLMLTNPVLPFFEALVIALSTISTGGLSTKNASIAGYDNIATEWVVVIFMIVGGVNFSLYYFMFKGKFTRVFQPEFVAYLAIILIFSMLIISSIIGTREEGIGGFGKTGIFDGADALRHGIFQLVSAQTSTGFFTTNFNIWPYTAQALLVIAMFVGGMSGSTAGGIKIIRHIILFRSAQYRVESLFRPEQVRMFKVGKREVDPNTALTVLSFFLIVIALSTLGTVLYIYDGIDLETSLGLTACMINNTGMSFRMAGPENSCAFLSNFSLALSSFLMLMGRLEFFAVLAVLIPAFWQQDS